MRSTLLAALAVVAAIPAAAPVAAQSRADEQRLDAAQARFDREYAIYQDELRRYRSLRGGPAGYRDDRRDPRVYSGYEDDRYENGYDAARYYRDGGSYQTRTLAADDRVYRGSDGRYYCRRSDGTTGLILGAAGGGILGNVIDGGHSRAAGTLIGGALGALAGRAIEQNQQQLQCR
jgi:opacity protein-like surface antigen